MRDRLIELLKNAFVAYGKDFLTDLTPQEFIADFILENGVIVPPCKVGDKVYVDEKACEVSPLYFDCVFVHSRYFLVGEIVSIIKTKKQVLMKIRISNSIHTRYRHQRFTVNAIGKTVFLTREDAEAALKGGANDV